MREFDNTPYGGMVVAAVCVLAAGVVLLGLLAAFVVWWL